MPVNVAMPKWGLTMKEGKITRWVIKEGAPVQKGEDLFEVETEKITNIVESPASGILFQILAPEGAVVATGTIVAVIAEAGEQPERIQGIQAAEPSPDAATPSGGPAGKDKKEPAEKRFVPASPAARRLAKELEIDLGQVPGSGPEGRVTEADVERFHKEGPPPPKITPSAQEMARQAGLDVSIIQGTGEDGKITKEDVLRAAEEKGKKPAPVAGALKQVKETIPIRGVRQVIFDRMHQSLQQSAQLTLTMEVNAAELGRFRKTLVDSLKDQGIRISYNAILVKVIARALEQHPRMNSSVVKDEIWLWESVNVGLAVDAEQGLIVPVVHDANKKDLTAIQKDIDDKVERAKSKKLVPDDLQGGTFTLTGLGFLDIEAFTPILNPPEVGILGVGKVLEKPVVENGQITVGQRMSLSLTFDHRIIDGADGARFLKTIKSFIETPYLLLA